MLAGLPDDLLLHVMLLLPPRDLIVLMAAGRRTRAAGMTCRRWTELRVRSGLPAPLPRAVKYKTDFHIVTAKCCRECFSRPSDQHGFCPGCRVNVWELRVHYHQIASSRKQLQAVCRKERLHQRHLLQLAARRLYMETLHEHSCTKLRQYGRAR